MIATVRIAPVERWCKAVLSDMAKEQNANYHKVAGVFVEIDTASMQASYRKDCDGRMWMLTNRSSRQLDDILGWSHIPQCSLLCEHMLEMD